MKIARQKNHLGGQSCDRSLIPVKKQCHIEIVKKLKIPEKTNFQKKI